jgi:hypothetical protein
VTTNHRRAIRLAAGLAGTALLAQLTSWHRIGGALLLAAFVIAFVVVGHLSLKGGTR